MGKAYIALGVVKSALASVEEAVVLAFPTMFKIKIKIKTERDEVLEETEEGGLDDIVDREGGLETEAILTLTLTLTLTLRLTLTLV